MVTSSMATENEIQTLRTQYRLNTTVDITKYEVDAITRALAVSAKEYPNGVLVFAAKLLGMHRSSLARKLRKYNIDLPQGA